ncbi:MAG: helix-turn-helix transcriptional regulator [Actinomycetota bacterium]
MRIQVKRADLKKFRLQAVLTQAEVARAAGLAVASYNRIENGKAVPRPSTMRAIAAALGVQVTDLVEVVLPVQRAEEPAGVTR